MPPAPQPHIKTTDAGNEGCANCEAEGTLLVVAAGTEVPAILSLGPAGRLEGLAGLSTLIFAKRLVAAKRLPVCND